MEWQALMQWLEASPVAEQIQLSSILFPLLESLHVVGVAIVFGTIAFVDLRLLGLSSRDQPVASVLGVSLRWTWLGFALALVTGSLMFVSSATTYATNLAFQLKFAALLLAGLNMAIFETRIVRGVTVWGASGPTPVAARLSGGLSILLWVSIVAFGRWIGFTKLPF